MSKYYPPQPKKADKPATKKNKPKSSFMKDALARQNTPAKKTTQTASDTSPSRPAGLVDNTFLIYEGQDYICLCDLLHASGICGSGGEAKTFITTGAVKVNGQVELRKTAKMVKGDVVTGKGFNIIVSVQEN